MEIIFTEYMNNKEKNFLSILSDIEEKEKIENELLKKISDKNLISYLNILNEYFEENRNILLLLRYYYLRERENDMKESFKSKFKTKEILNLEGDDLINLLKLSINDYIFSKNENINFEFEFFDNLKPKTLNILEDIYNNKDVSNENNTNVNKAINLKVWKDYSNSHIETFDINENVTSSYKKFFTYKPSHSIDYIENNNEFILTYDDIVLNEENLLYAFLNIILQCKTHYVIKKCSICKKFFVTTDTRTSTCNRIYINDKTCTEFRLICNKKNSSNDFVHKLENAVKNDFNPAAEYDNLQKFLIEYPEKRKKLTGKEYLFWLISHYKTGKTKEKREKEINDFLENNPDFEKIFEQKYHNK